MSTHIRLPFLAALLVILTAGTASSDELDDVIDDLVEYRQASLAATSSTRSNAEHANTQPTAAPVVAPFFQEISGYKSDQPTTLEETGVAEYLTTYYPRDGGTSYEVRIIFPLHRVNLVSNRKIKDTINLFQQSALLQKTTIQGFPTSFLGFSNGNAQGLVIEIGSQSYAIVRSSRTVSKEALIGFANKLDFEQIKLPTTA